MKARILVPLVAALLLIGGPAWAEGDAWRSYQKKYISADGRVIDYGQQGASHSEGQGFGLLLAAAHHDRQTFDLIWRWTKSNLRLRLDGLFAWKWGLRPTGNWEVMDYNNATDGDILIVFGLLKGYEQWHADEYRDEALITLRALRTKLAVQWQGKSFLLPAYNGFVHENSFVLNPSYLVFPAFRQFISYDDSKFWGKVYSDAYFVVSKSYFGRVSLPPDWLLLQNGTAVIDKAKGTRFGFEAVRLMLYLAQENTWQYKEGMERLIEWYEKEGYLPLWVDLESDGVALAEAPAGFYAVMANVAAHFGNAGAAAKLRARADILLAKEDKDYYSHSLYLLSTTDALSVPR